MPKMTFFLIRHKPTGKYLPAPSGRNGRGSSFMTPSAIWVAYEGATCTVPLMCTTNRQAKNVLTQWCRGKHFAHHDSDGGCEITIKPDGTRERENMEIVKVEFNLP